MCTRIDIGQCEPIVDYGEGWYDTRAMRSDFRRHSAIGASHNVNVNYIERLKNKCCRDRPHRLIIYRSSSDDKKNI